MARCEDDNRTGLSMFLSIVVPVYNEKDNVPIFLSRMVAVLEAMNCNFEIIFALDPSSDGTDLVIGDCCRRDSRIKLVTFSRRIGQPMATLAGMQYSRGDAVIIIDVDLQDPPELVPEMVAKWQTGFDVVMAQRRTREGEHWLKKTVSYLGYRIINWIADVEIPPNTGDFRLLSRRVVDEVCRLKECHGFLRGLVALVGFRQTLIPFDRMPRHSGRGNYNRYLGSLRIGLNGVICFSNYLLTMSTTMGLLIAVSSFLMAIAYFALKVYGIDFPTGIPTITILLLFLGGVQLISIGVLGEYLGRIYDEVRQRPKYIVDRTEGFSSASVTPREDKEAAKQSSLPAGEAFCGDRGVETTGRNSY